MEADGFTLVAQDSLNPTRMKTRDGETTILGITQEQAQRIYQQQQERKEESGVKQEYISGKEHKDLIKRDFYMFQKKLVMKESLEKLRQGFEEDKKRIQKSMEKDSRRKEKLLKVAAH